MIKAPSFKSIEASLASRLKETFTAVTSEVFEEVSDALREKDWDKAEKLVGRISLSPLVEKNVPYIRYMTNVAMLFGASRVTNNPGTTTVGMGFEKLTTEQLVQSFQNGVVRSAEANLKAGAMQLIALYRDEAMGLVQKSNPYHDKAGRFTSGSKAGGAGQAAIDSFLDEARKYGGTQWIKKDTVAYMTEQGFSELEIAEFSSVIDGHSRDQSQESSDVAIEAALSDPNSRFGEFLSARMDMEERLIEARDGFLGEQREKRREEVQRDIDQDIRMFGKPMGYEEQYDGPLDEWVANKMDDELSMYNTKLADAPVFRKGKADKVVLSTTTDPSGANTQVLTGDDYRITPDNSWSLKELKDLGYRPLAGMSTNYGYQGEAEVLFLRAGKKVTKANPYHDEKGLFSTKDGATPSIAVTEQGNWVTFKATDGDKDIGSLEVSIKDDSLQVREAHVGEEHRGKGYGKVLYKKAIAYAKEKGLGFHSDAALSVSADRVWQSLQKEGYPVERQQVELDTSLNKYYSVKEMSVGDVTFNIRTGVPPWRLLDKEEVKKAEPYPWDRPELAIDPDTGRKRRVLQSFDSFMDSQGEAAINVAASLHTSRVASYGFTAEAMALGITEYEWNEQLDDRICPVCRVMHKKRFKVKDARALLDIVTRVSSPDDLKSLQPWPKQTKASIAALKEMTTEELVTAGWHIGPYHPLCRGMPARVGKAPALDAAATTTQEAYEASEEDFKALGAPLEADKVKVWNRLVGMSPSEVLAFMQGKSVDELLSGQIAAKGLSFKVTDESVKILLNTKIKGSLEAVEQELTIKGGSLHIDKVAVSVADQATGVVKDYLSRMYNMTSDLGLKKIELTANMELGGYAWAKYGFRPNISQWEALKMDIRDGFKKGYNVASYTPDTKLALMSILESEDPGSIYTLSDLAEEVDDGLSVGEDILSGTLWDGELDLTDEESVLRFLTFMGDLK